ncbi:MAG: hypothetical protein IKP95_11400 [Ruminococcus sp.]|nr:hypothetical protein [Ruminococcus sp.]
MNRSFTLRCFSCRHQYGFTLWVSSLYPQEYKTCIKDIRTGKYGTEWQELFLKERSFAVDARETLYLCHNCRDWDIQPSLAAYLPKSEGKPVFSEKGAKPSGPVEFVSPEQLREMYLYKSYPHPCKRCGSRMKRANTEHLLFLTCPRCGAENEVLTVIDWGE